ncbi:MAG: peptide deformylase [Pseudomonadota bacterium]
MPARPIVFYPDDRLRQVAAPVDTDVADLTRDMFDTMYEAKGRGLAAPQVGVSRRVFVMDCAWKEGLPDPRVFVNPTIVAAEGQQVNEEGCLSIPGVPRRLTRPRRVVLSFDGPGGRRDEAFEGFAAACICHEVDHLDGVLILDHPEAA